MKWMKLTKTPATPPTTDTVAPAITLTSNTGTTANGIRIEAQIMDDAGVQSVVAYYDSGNGAGERMIALTHISGDLYGCEVTAQPGASVRFRMEASDGTNTARTGESVISIQKSAGDTSSIGWYLPVSIGFFVLGVGCVLFAVSRSTRISSMNKKQATAKNAAKVKSKSKKT